MNLFLKFLLWVTLFQVANGQITVTLVDENESPIAQETIQFVTYEQQVLASCVTNSQGRCTITIQNVPTDASGFIRGSLSINDRGKRPVIWPGGEITIQLMLDDGKLSVPSDLYVTRTPKAPAQTLVPEVVQTKTSPIPSVPASTPTAVSTPTSTSTVANTPTNAPDVVSTPASTPSSGGRRIEDKTLWGLSYSLWFQIGLLIILIAAATYYVLATLSNDNQAS